MKGIILPLFLLLQTGGSLTEQTRELADQVTQLRDEALALADRYEQAEGENREILRAQIVRRGDSLGTLIEQLATDVRELKSQGVDTARFEDVARQTLNAFSRLMRRDLQNNLADVESLSARRSDVSNGPALELEQQVTQRNQRIDRLLSSLSRVAALKDELSEDATTELDTLDLVLGERADALAGEAEILIARRTELNQTLARTKEESERNAVSANLSILRERLHSVTTSLQATISLMGERSMDTAAYRELLIRATGNVTADILDSGVAISLVRNGVTTATDWLVARAPDFIFKLLMFVMILWVFRLLARTVKRVVTRAMTRTEPSVPVLLKEMVISMSTKAVFVLGLLVALSQLGIEIGPFIAGLGVAGFIVGFALQETLSNFAAGMMLLFYHPFDVGDVVEVAGISGTVGSMSVVSTTIMTFDNQKLVVPNSKIWGDVIRNKSAETTRRVDMVFGISYDDDVEKARTVLTDIVSSHPSVLEEPAPVIRLHELADSSVNFIVRPWVKTADYWNVYWDVQWEVKTRFVKEGISIPYPQRDVHLFQERAEPETAKVEPETKRPPEEPTLEPAEPDAGEPGRENPEAEVDAEAGEPASR